MSNEGESGDQQQQHGGAVLRVAVDLSRHPNQPQQSGGLEKADEGGGLQKKAIKFISYKIKK